MKENIKALLYCTKGKPLFRSSGDYDDVWGFNNFFDKYVCARDYYNYHRDYETVDEEDFLNGKIVAECDFEVEEIIANDVNLYDEYGIKYTTKNGYSCIDDNFEALLYDSCLDAFELNDYLGGYGGYAIHIKDLDIWNTPRSLERMGIKSPIKNITKALALHTAGFTLERCIIIPVKPELMCKILNGECTIIVKKKVLKEMEK